MSVPGVVKDDVLEEVPEEVLEELPVVDDFDVSAPVPYATATIARISITMTATIATDLDTACLEVRSRENSLIQPDSISNNI